ncbi:MAG: VOC family protein [Acidimicrobiaceae bacterium]|nr:VOC family protein [Acidimicrobiaceae bacterium]
MPVRGIDHVAITVEDVERTVAFYTDLLDAETVFLDKFREGSFSVVTLVVGSNRINVHPSPPRAPQHLVARRPTPGSVDLCFRWDGPIEEVVALLSKHGLAVVDGPGPRPAADGQDAVSVYTRDPDGNLIEFLTTD